MIQLKNKINEAILKRIMIIFFHASNTLMLLELFFLKKSNFDVKVNYWQSKVFLLSFTISTILVFFIWRIIAKEPIGDRKKINRHLLNIMDDFYEFCPYFFKLKPLSVVIPNTDIGDSDRKSITFLALGKIKYFNLLMLYMSFIIIYAISDIEWFHKFSLSGNWKFFYPVIVFFLSGLVIYSINLFIFSIIYRSQK